MIKIKCPKCNELVEISDQASFSDIIRQVRDNEFNSALELAKQDALKLAEANFVKEKAELRSNFEKAFYQEKNEKEKAIREKESANEKLKVEKQQATIEKKHAVEKALSTAEKDKNELLADIQVFKAEKIALINENNLKVENIESKYKIILNNTEKELEGIKNEKAKLNTKLLGESLEKHCENSFDQLRSMAFQRAIFEKDNTSVKEDGDIYGSKGDYIFRELDDSGVEIVSIMFEMKTQEDETATKKRNEDFLDKLHKDRNKKKCDYAVLVSQLEPENDLYNNGIVDMSHKFEKMFVIRPQFFIPIISLLRNAGMVSIKDKRELQALKNDQFDLMNFEEDLKIFKSNVANNYRIAGEKFATAIDEIDKSIERLRKTKEALLSSERQLRIANDKVDEITIRKLTKNSPETKKKLEEIREGKK